MKIVVHKWVGWLVISILVIIAGVFGYLLTMPRSYDSDQAISKRNNQQMESVGDLVGWLKRIRSERAFVPEVREQVLVKDKYVMSYGVKEGIEEQLVRGVILRWGETYLEVETAEKSNYPLLLPEKTLWIRCLPLTITTSSGRELVTRNVYIDMLQDSYKGALMSTYSAPTVLPIGSEVLMLVRKDMKTNEFYSGVVAGYGCNNGRTDPLEQ